MHSYAHHGDIIFLILAMHYESYILYESDAYNFEFQTIIDELFHIFGMF